MTFENFMIEYTPQGVGDITPPAPVGGLIAYTYAKGVRMGWQNPPTSDYTGALIRYRTDAYPAGPFDGTLLDDISGAPAGSSAHTHRGGAPGQTYYYSVFAHDAALNYATPVTVQGVAPHAQPGDLDGDNDVDQSDFGRFQQCISGEGAVQDAPACAAARMDEDPDVDAEDLTLFRGCIGGADEPGDPDCAG
jgi:hypothetical protein